MHVNIGLSEKNRKEIAALLEKFLATSYALYLQTQNFHWNICGTEFFSLHILFEKHYEELAEAVDEIAERIVSIGCPVHGTFSHFNQNSAITQSTKLPPAKEMVQILVESHETICCIGRPLIRRLQELEDDISSDLILRRVSVHDKAAWMLRAHLEK